MPPPDVAFPLALQLISASVLLIVAAISNNPRAIFVECLTVQASLTFERPSRRRTSSPLPRPFAIRSRRLSDVVGVRRPDSRLHYTDSDKLSRRVRLHPLFDSNVGDGDEPTTPPTNEGNGFERKDTERTESSWDTIVGTDSVEEVVYRIAAGGDGKLRREFCRSPLFPKLHAVYHASTRFHKTSDRDDGRGGIGIRNAADRRTIASLRRSLDDAGFSRIGGRDLDLCEALNAGYLLRLAILPDIRGLDNTVGTEFYPQILTVEDDGGSDTMGKTGVIGNGGGKRYAKAVKNIKVSGYKWLSGKNNTGQTDMSETDEDDDNDDDKADDNDDDNDDYDTKSTPPLESPPLFDNRVLIFRRGYSSETTEGLLLGQKIDYLQSSLVQRSFSKLALEAADVERRIKNDARDTTSRVRLLLRTTAADVVEELPYEVGTFFMGFIERIVGRAGGVDRDGNGGAGTTEGGIERKIEFRRYGGSLVRFAGSDAVDGALGPFLVCEVPPGSVETAVEGQLAALDGGVSYDDDGGGGLVAAIAEMDDTHGEGGDGAGSDLSPRRSMRLLERVGISDIVDFFSEGGRKRLIESFTSESKLVEPAFEEVVVVWRPLPKKGPAQLRLPDSVYKLANTLDLDDRLPPKPTPPPPIPTPPLQIRVFSRVPMANLLAILPKTKLLFRPTDAVLFDLVNVVSLSVVLASQKLDSAYLDVLALGSISLWVVRTFVKYSNKQARYDLLVNKFLTSRMEHRNRGAEEYLSNEAAEQRAMRASLLHEWLIRWEGERVRKGSGGPLTKRRILKYGQAGVNEVIRRTAANESTYVDTDVAAALDDLVEFRLVRFGKDDSLVEVKSYGTAEDALRSTWGNLFQKEM